MTNLTLTQKYKLFQRLTGWSRDKIRANDKAVKDLLSDSGGGGGGGGSNYSTNIAKLTDGQYATFDDVPFGIGTPNENYGPDTQPNAGWTRPPREDGMNVWTAEYEASYGEIQSVDDGINNYAKNDMYLNAIYIIETQPIK